MATPKSTVWAIEDHTKVKHEILKSYLEAWFPILGSKFPHIAYVDGFCGPGRYDDGQIGSPLVALGVAIDQQSRLPGSIDFWFIDKEEKRIENLDAELEKLSIPPRFKVHRRVGKFDAVVWAELASISSAPPTFAFIDPFGFAHIPFELIKRLLQQSKAEVFINFMVDSMNRWLEHPDEKVWGHIVEAFGTEKVREIAGGPNRIQHLRDLYFARLKEVSRFVQYFEMRNKQNRVQFYLFFASNSRTGFVKMKEAMWRADPEGKFSFSDATNFAQGTLFPSGTHPKAYRPILDRFRGERDVIVERIKTFVEEETVFLEKHMKAALKQLEAEGEITVSGTKKTGEKRRKGSFPDDVVLSFK